MRDKFCAVNPSSVYLIPMNMPLAPAGLLSLMEATSYSSVGSVAAKISGFDWARPGVALAIPNKIGAAMANTRVLFTNSFLLALNLCAIFIRPPIVGREHDSAASRLHCRTKPVPIYSVQRGREFHFFWALIEIGRAHV